MSEDDRHSHNQDRLKAARKTGRAGIGPGSGTFVPKGGVVEPDVQKRMADTLSGFSVSLITIPGNSVESGAFVQPPVQTTPPKQIHRAQRTITFQFSNPNMLALTLEKYNTLLAPAKISGEPPVVTGARGMTLTSLMPEKKEEKDSKKKKSTSRPVTRVDHEYSLSMSVEAFMALADKWKFDASSKLPREYLDAWYALKSKSPDSGARPGRV